MGISSILIYGKTTKDKSQFVKKLSRDTTANVELTAPAFLCGQDTTHGRSYQFWILDTAYPQFVSLYSKDAELVIYFVDQWDEHQIHHDLNEVRKVNPSVPILIMGSPPHNSSFMLNTSFSSCPTVWLSSDCKEEEMERVLIALDKKLQEEQKLRESRLLFDALTPIQKAKSRALKGSPLYSALENLEQQMKSIPAKTAEAVGQSAEKLMQSWKNIDDSSTITATFLNECQGHLNGQHHDLWKVVVTVAMIAAITLAVALIGFAVGFGLGIWTGPGAFLSGIIAGTAAADTVLTSCLIGVGVGGLISCGIFKPDPVTKAANAVVRGMVNPPPVDLDNKTPQRLMD